MERSCCPQYTIRLDARQVKPNKKQRQVVNRWNRYLSTGNREVAEASEGGSTTKGDQSQGAGSISGKAKGKAKAKQGDFNWPGELHRYEKGQGESSQHVFETVLVPAKATSETFDLYRRYQIAVHKDKPEKVTMSGFRRFLCDSPLSDEDIHYTSSITSKDLPQKYGSYHLLYKVDGKLVGISVIDILPRCVSSVYFIWDPDWSWASLGKLSALYEISLSRRMQEAGGLEGWVYMGYWIANCQKMRYKSEYSPSFLLDPGTNEFHSLTPLLDKFLQAHPKGYHPFANIAHSSITGAENPTPKETTSETDIDEEEDDDEDLEVFPHPPPPGFLDPRSIEWSFLDKMLVFLKGQLVPFKDLRFRDPAGMRQDVCELVAALGKDMLVTADKGSGDWKNKAMLYLG